MRPAAAWDAEVTLPAHFAHKHVSRQYFAVFPEKYQKHKARKWPAVVIFHGNGADAAALSYENNMTQLAPRHGYVLVFAQGVQTPGSVLPTRERSWNAGSCCDEALLSKADDVQYVRWVIEDLPKRLRVDPKRVFLSGTSNGGSMALRSLCELSQLVAGVAVDVPSFEPRDGTKCAADCWRTQPTDGYRYCSWNQRKKGCRREDWFTHLPELFKCDMKPRPVMMFNGLLDPYGNVSGQVELPDKGLKGGYTTTFPPTWYVAEEFARLNRCRGSTMRTSYVRGTAANSTKCETFLNCHANVTLCLSQAGHRWFGDHYNRQWVCEKEGYSSAACAWPVDEKDYGPNTDSVRVTVQALEFFNRAPGLSD